MEYLTVSQFAAMHGLSERTVRNWCSANKMRGAFLSGKTWNIPADAPLPDKKKSDLSPLLNRLREEKDERISGGIYHRVQIDLTYNSNHIEGGRLTLDQTRLILETNSIVCPEVAVSVDDIVVTANHFRCIDMIIDRAEEIPSEAFVKSLHNLLMAGTSDSRKGWFNVGEYKWLPNDVGGMETCPPEEVHGRMKTLFSNYNSKKEKTLEDILDLHQKFEMIHPFQDGNGRVGRLLMFKECLAHGIVPFIITDELKLFYYRGLREWGRVHGFLMDPCLEAQDHFKDLLDSFEIKYQA